MEKLYSYAGVSTGKNGCKVRWANDQMRVKVLAKCGDSDIDIVQLKEPMTKKDAVAYLLSIDFANGNKTVQAALEAAAEKRGLIEKPASVETPKKERKAKKVKTVEPELDGGTPVTEDETAPF